MAVIPSELQIISQDDRRTMPDQLRDSLEHQFRSQLGRMLDAFGEGFRFRTVSIYCKHNVLFPRGVRFLSPLLDSEFEKSPSVFFKCIMDLFDHRAFSDMRVFKSQFATFELDEFIFAATGKRPKHGRQFNRSKPFTKIMAGLEEFEISHPNESHFDYHYYYFIGELLHEIPIPRFSLRSCNWNESFMPWYGDWDGTVTVNTLTSLRLRGFRISHQEDDFTMRTIGYFPNLRTLHLSNLIMWKGFSWANTFDFIATRFEHLSCIFFAVLTYDKTEFSSEGIFSHPISHRIKNSSKTSFRRPLVSDRHEDVDALERLLEVVKQRIQEQGLKQSQWLNAVKVESAANTHYGLSDPGDGWGSDTDDTCDLTL